MPDSKTESITIFIVDDDMFLIDMYATRFTQSGFTVERAMAAEQVLEKLRGGFVPDVLLMDVVMPGMDGFELLEKITTEKLAPASIKIYLSNLGQDQDVSRGKALGAAGYIIKANSTPTEVVQEVQKIISKIHGL